MSPQIPLPLVVDQLLRGDFCATVTRLTPNGWQLAADQPTVVLLLDESVRLTSSIAVGVKPTKALLAELNDQNALMDFTTIAILDGELHVTCSVPLRALRPGTFCWMYDQVQRHARAVGPVMLATFGGEPSG